MIPAKTIFEPATGTTNTLTGDTNSETFKVDTASVVIYIAPAAGEVLTEDDSFELRRVIQDDPQLSTKQLDKDGAIQLGNSIKQFEVLIRGTYVIRKILTTTESVGVYQAYGLEDGV